jgi:anthranilate synthase component 1
MEIIENLEPSRRGLYGGALGYLDFTGNIDTCIVIRTAVIRDGFAFVQAGAGIVADSDANLENQECLNKAAAVLGAINSANNLKLAK